MTTISVHWVPGPSLSARRRVSLLQPPPTRMAGLWRQYIWHAELTALRLANALLLAALDGIDYSIRIGAPYSVPGREGGERLGAHAQWLENVSVPTGSLART